MILKPHHTRCPACHRYVYVTDPLFIAENWKGVERIPGFVPGIYHESCFLNSPYREAYLAVDRGVRNAEFDNPNEYLVVLGRTPQYALTLRSYTGVYQLWFLTSGRVLRFHPQQRWQNFLAQVAGPDGAKPTPPGDRDELRVRRTQDGWELAIRYFVPIQGEFSQTDFARLRQHLDSRGTDPARTVVNLGIVCGQLGINPLSVSCPLDRLIGTFIWPDVPADPTLAVSLSVQVEMWATVTITDTEMQELRAFLKTMKRPS